MRNYSAFIKLLFTIVGFLSAQSLLFATHLVGGDLTYRFIEEKGDSNVYEVTLTVIRDNSNSEVEFDEEVEIGVYLNNSDRRRHVILSIPLTQWIRITPSCILASNSDKRFEQGIYRKKIALPHYPAGYTLNWDRCCKTISRNLPAPVKTTPITPIFFQTVIPNFTLQNSSPRVNSFVRGVCTGRPSVLGTTVLDPDGDSVVVALAEPIKGGATLSATLSKPTPPLKAITPELVDYVSGFSHVSPFGSKPGNSIAVVDSNLLKITVVEPGAYYVTYKVTEYRNGIELSSQIVDVLVHAFVCSPDFDGNTPNKLVATEFSHFESLVQWSSCENRLERYQVYRSKDSKATSDFKRVAEIGPFHQNYLDTSINSTGLYYYYVTGIDSTGQDVGSSNIDSVRFFNLGVNEHEEWRFSIHPNPTSGRVHINTEHGFHLVRITDLRGQIVGEAHMDTDSRTQTLNVSGLAPGCYHLTVTGNGWQGTRKLLLE
ncbi:MAG: T9SS type A sorting domain-containing protein [Bacteroidia bacterium]|nr:T9SS type A sorting domain-containing protein [Bacteroidia bacterium]